MIKPLVLSNRLSAVSAALAMFAAHAQGRGWAMHDPLFQNSDSLTSDDLLAYARQAGVRDIEQFKTDVIEGVSMLEDNIKLAGKLGVTGTPSFFINGVPHRGFKAFEALRELYVAELDRVDALLVAGAEPKDVYAILRREATPTREPFERPVRVGKPDPSLAYAVPVDDRPTRGPDDALVTVIEFADFECPYSRKVQATLDELRSRYGKDLRIVFRHHPLSIHPHAKGAARAAIAADRQGKFWAMHDAVWELGTGISSAVYDDIAAQLGLDLAKFRADMAAPDVAAQLLADAEIAARFGASGTPSFFINGRPLSGAQPLASFTELIDEEFGEAKAYAAKHELAGAQLYATMAADWEIEVKKSPTADHLRRTISTDGLARKGAIDDPELTVVVRADFDCPYSKRGAQIWSELLAMDQYEDKIAYHFANFPLSTHLTAQLAHQAAVAAGNQGKFWEMHDWLFANGEQRTEADLIDAAVALGLDGVKFEKDLHSQDTFDRISDRKALCAKHGTSGTPQYYVNGRSMRGAVPIDKVIPVLDEELAGGFEQAGKP